MTVGKIVGTKGWEFTLRGVFPPGMSEQEATVWVLNAVSLATALMQYARGAEVNVIDLTPPPGDGGQPLSLKR